MLIDKCLLCNKILDKFIHNKKYCCPEHQRITTRLLLNKEIFKLPRKERDFYNKIKKREIHYHTRIKGHWVNICNNKKISTLSTKNIKMVNCEECLKKVEYKNV